MHLDEWCHLRGIAEVVGVRAACQRRAGGRFDGDNARVLLAAQLAPDERERQPGEVRSPTRRTDDDVRVVAGHLKLEQRLLPDDGLVQQHVVEHAAQAVLHVVVRRGDFTASLIAMPSEPSESVLRQDGTPGVRQIAGAGVDRRPVDLIMARR